MKSRTSLAILWIYKLGLSVGISAALALGVSGCALFKDNTGPPPVFGPREEVINSSFDNVWRATQLALQKYAIKVNNYDLGLLETETIDSFKAWKNPFDTKRSTGLSYRLIVKIVKGRNDGKEACKVSVFKDIARNRDFFAESENLPSDGWEELSILYRIRREVEIERGLQNAQKRQNKSL